MPNLLKKSAQQKDENGFLLIKGCPISSYGIFDYGAGQVGETEGDPMRVVKVFRPESAVRDPDLISSLKSMPFIDDHDYLNGNPDATEDEGMAPEEKGIDGVITDNVYYAEPWLKADLKIFSRRLQKAVDEGKKDLSLGYNCKFTHSPGTWRGQPYEYVQTDMRGNHIALVDEARVPGARVLDGRVFDSMRLDITPSNNRTEKSMDEELKALLQKLLPLLQRAAGGGTEAGAEGGQEQEHEEPGAEAGAEGGNEGGEAEEFSLEDACHMLDELLPQLKAKAGVGAEKGADGENTEDRHGKDGEGKETADNEEMEEEDKETGDAVEGLEEGGDKPDLKVVESGNPNPDGKEGGKTGEGPRKGIAGVTGDSALRAMYADVAQRDALYAKVSREVGAFDHKRMTAADVALYGAKKLGLTHSGPKSARIALDAYFMGKKKQPATTTKTHTADSAFGQSNELDAWLNGGK